MVIVSARQTVSEIAYGPVVVQPKEQPMVMNHRQLTSMLMQVVVVVVVRRPGDHQLPSRQRQTGWQQRRAQQRQGENMCEAQDGEAELGGQLELGDCEVVVVVVMVAVGHMDHQTQSRAQC